MPGTDFHQLRCEDANVGCWPRDQKLRAAIDFIGGTGDLYQRRRQLLSAGSSLIDGQAAWARVQDGRSAVHLLCEASTVDMVEAVVMRVGHTAAEGDRMTTRLRCCAISSDGSRPSFAPVSKQVGQR